MNHSFDIQSEADRRSSSGLQGRPKWQRRRRESNISNASVVSEVDMAADEIYAGPISGSIPSSVTGFAYRRSRKDSISSFGFLEGEQVFLESTDQDPSAKGSRETCQTMEDLHSRGESFDVESGFYPGVKRRSSSFGFPPESNVSLLQTTTAENWNRDTEEVSRRYSQRCYIKDEDLTIHITGYTTGFKRLLLVALLNIFTLGICSLLMYWSPRWKIKLVGSLATLKDCDWVAVENQWGELSMFKIKKLAYGYSYMSVFMAESHGDHISDYEDEQDFKIEHLTILDYRYIRFCFDPLNDQYALLTTWKDPRWINLESMRDGLTRAEQTPRGILFGKNSITVDEKSATQILIEEVLHPFYIFQLGSLILWSLDEYYYYAICIFLISLMSIATTFVETRGTLRRLRDMSTFECNVRVLRNGFWRQLSSLDLVPGDVYEVSDPSLAQCPCDSILLSGDCIVNESMLTGESVPVTKFPATPESLQLLCRSSNVIDIGLARHYLFSGTSIIRAQKPTSSLDNEAAALAVVIRTGFNTVKGSLIRSMLFPRPSDFKLYQDAFRYVSVMALVAGIGFIVSCINFIRLSLSWQVIIVRALDLVTIVIPPALPATLSIGTSFAISRLKKMKIFCISPHRINMSGKIDVVCFDKTGTMTEDGLDVLGVHVGCQQSQSLSPLLVDCQALLQYQGDRINNGTYDPSHSLLHAMASCHSLRCIDDQLLGDPLDMKMFEFTRWSLEEVSVTRGMNRGNPFAQPSMVLKAPRSQILSYSTLGSNGISDNLQLLKSFEFISQLRRTSVVVGNNVHKKLEIFTKGAPEAIQCICRRSSMPPDFENLLNRYTNDGYRVIACATKALTGIEPEHLNTLHRSEIESNMDFIGFIVFENRLKAATFDTISELQAADIRTVMCTGDNILTAISVARESKIIPPESQCYVPKVRAQHGIHSETEFTWQCIEDSQKELDGASLEPINSRFTDTESTTTNQFPNFTLALTGDIFRWIIDYGNRDLIGKMLVHGSVFARMSPDEKHELVEKLQSIGYSCCFCGDGANDCGALKAADVGVSLSEAEASVAAPFTSHIFDISCVPQIIREGRAALVTSISCFKYMSIYSAIQFCSVSLLYSFGSNLGDFQFLYIDICLVLPIAIFMGWSRPSIKLSTRQPTANLVSKAVLLPLLSQIFVFAMFQMFCFFLVRQQSWYFLPKGVTTKRQIESFENTCLFTLSCFQYGIGGYIMCSGPPFRRPLISNIPFVLTMMITTFVSTAFLLDSNHWLREVMQLKSLPLSFKLCICGIATANLLVLRFGGDLITSLIRLTRYSHTSGAECQKRSHKEYSSLLGQSRVS